MSRPPWWRRQFYVHPIQRKYLALSLIPLLLCSLAMFALAFLPLNLLVREHPGDFSAVVASSCLGLVGQRLWLAVFGTMLVVAGLSILATHALAGPLMRLEKIGKQLAAGELHQGLQIRQGDDLQEIAADLDTAIATLRGALLEIRERAELAQAELRAAPEDRDAAGRAAPALAEALAKTRSHLDAIAAALKPFRL